MRRISVERQEYWKRIIGDQEESGESVRAYCRSREIGEHSFYMWRKRLQQQSTRKEGAKPIRFALVKTDAAMAAGAERTGVEVTLVSGERVHVPPGADAKTLRMVLTVLSEAR